MLVLTVSIIFLLLYNYNSADSDDIIFSRDSVPARHSSFTKCTEASQCLFSDEYAVCEEGYGPNREQAICVNGKCHVILRCSQHVTPTSTINSDLSANSPAKQCQTDVECYYIKQCVNECKDNSWPLCAISECIHGKCIITAACSQKAQCTDTDTSRCISPRVCERCKPGYSLPCAEATCEHGYCKVTMRCTVVEEFITTTTEIVLLSPDTCSNDNQCFYHKICAVKCSDGFTPLCATAKCENNKCIDIKPCSQYICKTKATCPYNIQNCVTCPNGYEPNCEEAACVDDICSIIPPCTKKFNSIVDILAMRKN